MLSVGYSQERLCEWGRPTDNLRPCGNNQDLKCPLASFARLPDGLIMRLICQTSDVTAIYGSKDNEIIRKVNIFRALLTLKFCSKNVLV